MHFSWVFIRGVTLRGAQFATSETVGRLSNSFWHQPIVTYAGYPNDPGKLCAECWCAVSLKFLEWRGERCFYTCHRSLLDIFYVF